MFTIVDLHPDAVKWYKDSLERGIDSLYVAGGDRGEQKGVRTVVELW